MDEVVEAVNCLYHGHDPELKEQAEEFLTSVRASEESVHYVRDLLGDDMPAEAQFFAVSLLQAHASSFKAKQPELFSGLQDLLLEYIVRHESLPPFVYRRLCSVLSEVIFKSVPESWSGAFEGVLNLLLPLSMSAALEFMASFIEEGSKLIEQKTASPAIMQEINDARPVVIPVLSQVLSDAEADHQSQIAALRCFAGWIESGLIPIADIADLLNAVVTLTESDATFPQALECLVALASHPDMEDSETLLSMVNLVLQLRDVYATALEEGDDERTEWICKLITELVDFNTEEILTLDAGPDLFSMFISVTAHPLQYALQETQSELTLKVWYHVLKTFVELDKPVRHKARATYLPLLMELLRVLHKKIQYPESIDSLTEDYEQQIEKYREEAGNVVMFIACFTSSACLQSLLQMLDENVRDATTSWVTLEATLTCIYRSVTFAGKYDEETMESIITHMQLQPQNKFVSIALVQVAGALGTWLSNTPDLIPSTLDLILDNMDTVTSRPRSGSISRDLRGNWNTPAKRKRLSVSEAAAEAFRDLCEGCGSQLFPFFTKMVEVYRNATTHGMPTESRALFAEGIVLMSRTADINHAVEMISTLLSEEFSYLQVCADDEHPEESGTINMPELGSGVRVIGHALRFVKWGKDDELPQSLYELLEFVFEKTGLLFQRAPLDEPTSDAFCALIMNCMRVSADLVNPFVEPLAHALSTGFVSTAHEGIIGVLRSLVVLYGKAPHHQLNLLKAFHTVHAGVIDWFEGGQHMEVPDAIAEYFSLVCQILRAFGSEVLMETLHVNDKPLLLSITQWTFASILLPEPIILRQVSAAIVELLRAMAQSDESRAIIVEEGVGQMCLETCMQAVCSAAPLIAIPDIAKCIAVFKQKYPASFNRLLPMVLGSLDLSLTDTVLKEFVMSCQDRTSVGELTQLFVSFASMCRA